MGVKKIVSVFIVITILFTVLPLSIGKDYVLAKNANVITNIKEIQEYGDVRGKDLSKLNLKNKLNLLYTLKFDKYTIWPKKGKMPSKFNPDSIMEFGKDPGLNVRKIQKQGYTGEGVNVAYVDQPLLDGHEAYDNVNLKNNNIKVDGEENYPSMHGPAVLSLLAGKESGIAPKANVYFFGHPAWLRDQRTHAKALYDLIKINNKLPKKDRVRIVGFSDTPDPSENYIEEYKRAIIEAEKNDIMVIDVTTMNIVPLSIKPYKDKNNYKNYEVGNLDKNANIDKNSLCVPTSGRTVAVGYSNDKSAYDYETNGGLSWAVPYIVGTIALGMQINPNLSKEEAIKFLYDSGYNFKNGKMINPEGFVKMVKQKFEGNFKQDYRYFLYNKNSVSSNDLIAIKDYIGRFEDNTDNILKDVSSYSSAIDIYNMLKSDSKNKKGNLKGIQIFGTSSDVPAFDVNFKIQMKDSIDEGGIFKSDFFYSNFKSESKALKSDFSIYKAFEKKLNVSFSPEWVVSRLPLEKGEISTYIKKNYEYVNLTKNKEFNNIVNFSNPIFASLNHSDDFGYFLSERMDKEFNILNKNQYKLYGNKQGIYPVNTNVLGDFTKENIAKENKSGIKEFIINSHGQWNNIDQCIYTKKDKSSEKRISFLNNDNINKVLSSNYYNLDMDLLKCL